MLLSDAWCVLKTTTSVVIVGPYTMKYKHFRVTALEASLLMCVLNTQRPFSTSVTSVIKNCVQAVRSVMIIKTIDETS